MRVADLMSKHVWTIGMSDSCHDAAARMCREKIRHLPVVAEDGTLQGIVTDRDLRHHLFGPGVFGQIGSTAVHALLKACPIREIMTTPVLSIRVGASVEEAARLMRQHRIGSLPVVEAGRVVGILTETDLLRHIVRADEACCEEVECIVVSYP